MIKKICATLAVIFTVITTIAQTVNTSTEIIDYKEVDGKIVLEALVNGTRADFVLDLAGHNSILPEYFDKFGIDKSTLTTFSGYNTYQYKKTNVDGVYLVDNISVGNGAFGNGTKFFQMKDEPYLRKLGVVGVLNASLFMNSVVTIDTERKKITLTTPYRPPYMKLDYRVSCEVIRGTAAQFDIVLDGVSYPVILDTWNSGDVTLNSADYAKFAAGKPVVEAVTSSGYGENRAVKGVKADKFSFGKLELHDVVISENPEFTRSTIGLGVLKKVIISVDYGKLKIYCQPNGLVTIDDASMKAPKVVIEAGKLNPITRDYFIENIFDYRKGGDFVSKSDKPIVIDFWATWCGPCMRLLPQMEAFAEKYKDQVIFMKVNADKEKELCNTYKVQALPTLFYIPAGGKPIIDIGADAAKIMQMIETKLLDKK